jgi:hypothetical protein
MLIGEEKPVKRITAKNCDPRKGLLPHATVEELIEANCGKKTKLTAWNIFKQTLSAIKV